jgi:hypothetical protein
MLSLSQCHEYTQKNEELDTNEGRLILLLTLEKVSVLPT